MHSTRCSLVSALRATATETVKLPPEYTIERLYRAYFLFEREHSYRPARVLLPENLFTDEATRAFATEVLDVDVVLLGVDNLIRADHPAVYEDEDALRARHLGDGAYRLEKAWLGLGPWGAFKPNNTNDVIRFSDRAPFSPFLYAAPRDRRRDLAGPSSFGTVTLNPVTPSGRPYVIPYLIRSRSTFERD